MVVDDHCWLAEDACTGNHDFRSPEFTLRLGPITVASEAWIPARAKVSRVRGDKHPELVKTAAVLAEIRADLEPHLRKEEEVLFPMIRTLASATHRPSFPCGSITNPIAVREEEHTAVGGLLEQLRALQGRLPGPCRHLRLHTGVDGGSGRAGGRYPPACAQGEQPSFPSSHQTGEALTV